MLVHQVQARDFRNLQDVAVELHPRFNVFAGDNAQGKTSLLEAVYLLVCQRSFRSARNAEMIRFGAQRAQITASFEHSTLQRDVRVTLERNGRKVELDGKPHRSAAAWPAGLTAVLFTPEDLGVPRGSPTERRKLLDRAVATIWPGYVELARNYQRTLHARNKVLRDHPARLTELLDTYDAQLAGLGAKVIAARYRCVVALQDEFIAAFRRIVDEAAEPELAYTAAVEREAEQMEVGSLSEALLGALTQARPEDLRRRITTVGPHHDDLDFRLAQRSARQYASQGQVRALVLSFRISQILDSYERFGHYPLLLLDDVSSELDPLRNRQLFEFIETISCQLFVTTTRPELIPLEEKGKSFQVDRGRIWH